MFLSYSVMSVFSSLVVSYRTYTVLTHFICNLISYIVLKVPKLYHVTERKPVMCQAFLHLVGFYENINYLIKVTYTQIIHRAAITEALIPYRGRKFSFLWDSFN